MKAQSASYFLKIIHKRPEAVEYIPNEFLILRAWRLIFIEFIGRKTTRSRVGLRATRSWLRSWGVLPGGFLFLALALCPFFIQLSLAASPNKAALRDPLERQEDSLQSLLADQPENAALWVTLGKVSVQRNQYDLARGYFDEAIKLSSKNAETILDIGGYWLTQGLVKYSLVYLMPNLGFLNDGRITTFEEALEKARLNSILLTVLRHHISRKPPYYPVVKKAAQLAYLQGDFALCRRVLLERYEQLDYEGGRNLLLVNIHLNDTLPPKVIAAMARKFPQPEVAMLANINYALAGHWSEVRDYLNKEAKSASYRDLYLYLQGKLANSEDKIDAAAEDFERAADTTRWEEMKSLIQAELYHLYSSTGNKYKADQLWEALKEQANSPLRQEYMARHLDVRGYEKQARYYWRSLLRKSPGQLQAIKALWEELNDEENVAWLQENVKAILAEDPYSCEGNSLAMNFHAKRRNDRELVPYGRNVALYCHDPVDAYLTLASALASLSKPEEARSFYAKYVKRGGDINRVPTNFR